MHIVYFHCNSDWNECISCIFTYLPMSVCFYFYHSTGRIRGRKREKNQRAFIKLSPIKKYSFQKLNLCTRCIAIFNGNNLLMINCRYYFGEKCIKRQLHFFPPCLSFPFPKRKTFGTIYCKKTQTLINKYKWCFNFPPASQINWFCKQISFSSDITEKYQVTYSLTFQFLKLAKHF